MKYWQYLSLAILLIVLSPRSFAAEKITIENMSLLQAAQSPAELTFAGILTGEAKNAQVGSVFTEGGDYADIALPVPQANLKPIAYPRWAVTEGWEGELLIAVEVLTDGSVGRHKVMQSTGHRMLDEAAASGIQKWKFHPATRYGKPIVTCIQIPVLFRLD